MLQLTPQSRILLALAPVDFRNGIDGLAAVCRRHFARNPLDGAIYVFRNRAGTRIKVICLDAQGVWLCVRRLHEGSFHWPRSGEAAWWLSPEQFAWLAAGVDWQRLSRDVRTLPNIV